MSMRVVVIGAGIVGTALAARLAEDGAQVVLVDGGGPGGGTTATSLAWTNANRKQPRAYFELNAAAMRDWAELAAGSGDPPWHRATGHLCWAWDDGAAELVARVERLREWGYAAELVSERAASRIEPAASVPRRAVAAFFPLEGYVHGRQAAVALARRAEEHGAQLRTGDLVAGVVEAGGRLAGVRLASGEPVSADAVVCCAGWRSNELLEPLGAALALTPADVPGSPAPCLVVDTTPLAARPERVVSAPGMFARPAWEGGMRLELDDLDSDVGMATSDEQLAAAAAEAVRRAAAMLPVLVHAGAGAAYRCVRPLPVDGYPIAGWHEAVPGLYVLVTHSGITLAPRLAALAAAEILGDRPSADLAPYRPDRFTRPPPAG